MYYLTDVVATDRGRVVDHVIGGRHANRPAQQPRRSFALSIRQEGGLIGCCLAYSKTAPQTHHNFNRFLLDSRSHRTDTHHRFNRLFARSNVEILQCAYFCQYRLDSAYIDQQLIFGFR